MTGILSTLLLVAITTFGLYSVYMAGYREGRKSVHNPKPVYYVTRRTVTKVRVVHTHSGDVALNPN